MLDGRTGSSYCYVRLCWDDNVADTILDRWDITADDLTVVVDRNPSLRGMVLGYLAELKLERLWLDRPGVSDVLKPDDHDRSRKGDRRVTYKGRAFTFESKSLQTNTVSKTARGWTGKAQVDASDRRVVQLPDGSSLQTTCLLRGQFDILAINVFEFLKEWKFVFAKNHDLPTSTFRRYTEFQRQNLLATLVTVRWPPEPPSRDEPFSLMDELL